MRASTPLECILTLGNAHVRHEPPWRACIADTRMSGYDGCLGVCMRDLAELFKAFSDETRLQMVVLLQRHGELCVCDFEGVLGLSQSASSRHLRRLYQVQVADSRRQGAWVYYRLRADLTPARRSLVQAAVRHCPPDRVAALDEAYQRWVQQKASGGSCSV